MKLSEAIKKTPGVSKKQARSEMVGTFVPIDKSYNRRTSDDHDQLPKLYSDDQLEVSPPDRKHQVKGIKKHMAQKKGKDKIPKTYVDKKTGKRKKTNPWALAWAQYDKYGVPSRIEKD